MKNFIRILLLTFLLTTNIFLLSRVDKSVFKNISGFIYYSPCNTPIPYRIGLIDQRFNILKDDFFSDLKFAAKVWSNTQGKDLFVYDQKATLSVNLVFDERQSLNQQISELGSKIKAEEGIIKPEIESYERQSADFKRRLESLNSQIESWNQKGGAPYEAYTKLINEQEALKKEANRLNDMAKKLNLSTDLYNTKVGALNKTVQSFNQALTLRPEEGIYKAEENRIDIYLHNNRNELIHTLAHEMGHVLGLTHVANEKAIMYPYTTEQITPSTEEALALSGICQKRNIFKIFFSRIADQILRLKIQSN